MVVFGLGSLNIGGEKNLIMKLTDFTNLKFRSTCSQKWRSWATKNGMGSVVDENQHHCLIGFTLKWFNIREPSR